MAEMVNAGFTGSETTVRDAVAKWRKQVNSPVIAPVRLLSIQSKPLVNAPANDQRRRKLCIPLHRIDVPERTATENGATAVARLLSNVENEE